MNTRDELARITQMLRADPRCRSFGPASSSTILFVSQKTAAALRRQAHLASRPACRLPERDGVELVEWLDSGEDITDA